MSRRGLRTVLIVVGAIAGATVIARRLGYNLGANTVVRCRQGHLFTTIWIPGVKFKELDLVMARVQRCPVGNHWSLVVPVRDADLTEEERQFAREHHDVHIPLRKPAARNGAPDPWPRHGWSAARTNLGVRLASPSAANRPDEDARTPSPHRGGGHRVLRLLRRGSGRAGRRRAASRGPSRAPAGRRSALATRRTLGFGRPPRTLGVTRATLAMYREVDHAMRLAYCRAG